jgi:hypothetical protein
MTTVEHRVYPRYKVHWHASLIMEVENERISHEGHTQDVSLGGASFYTRLNLLVKKPVILLLNIPQGVSKKDWIILKIKCRMIYTVACANDDRFCAGLQFLALTDANTKTLNEVLRFRTPISII